MPAQVKRNNRKATDSVVNAGLAGASLDVVSRYGSGIKEHIVAYGGVDNETGFKMHRSLKDFANTKISANPKTDPKGYNAQLRSKAGYAAEVKEVARRRAEEAISGKKPSTVRTDDTFKPDGTRNVNHPLYDITSAKVDANGNPIPGCSAQMKFRGSNPKQCLGILAGKDCRKYVENDCKLMVPKDYYDGVKAEASKKIKSLQEQIKRLKATGDARALAAKEAELAKYKTIERNLRKSRVTNAEAQEGAVNPEVSTAKDCIRVANRAGFEQAKMGAAIGGGVSVVRNAIALCRDEKNFAEAAQSIVKDTASAGAVSYATGFVGSVVKGAMQNSKRAVLRAASKSGLPAMIATSALEVGKTMKRYIAGEIDGTQCLEEMGEKGCGMMTAGLFTVVGQVAIPIPVVGAMIGSMAGYALSSSSYRILLDSLKAAKHAREERIRIERECEDMIANMRQFRKKLEAAIEKYLADEQCFFDSVFSEIHCALEIGDVDGYIAATNRITTHCGKKPLYCSMGEFDTMMQSETCVLL